MPTLHTHSPRVLADSRAVKGLKIQKVSLNVAPRARFIRPLFFSSLPLLRSRVFEVDPENLFSIKEEILIEIDSLENFDKEKKNLFNKYTNDLNNYKEEALKILSNINKGVSFFDTRLKEFLDFESKKYKKNKKKTPAWVKTFYEDVSDKKLNDDERYSQLSKFNDNQIKTHIRKQACQYMLNYLPSMSLKSGKLFKEINYLISTYKKEKNKTELIYLKDYIEKYPILNEFYGEKINLTILKLKP